MGSYHTISLLYVILYASIPSAQMFMTLDCDHSVTGIFKEDTKLPCAYESTNVGTSIFIELRKYGEDGESTPVFNSSVGGAQGRIKLLQDSQNISLVIQKTELSDSGTYQYTLETDVGYRYRDITLKVKAPYSLPEVTLFPNLTRTMRTTKLTCETTGYPLAQIHWFVDDKMNLTHEAKSSSVKTTEGLFKITSTLPIKVAESAPEGNYTCVVWNVEEKENEVQKHFLIPVLDPLYGGHQSEEKRNKVRTRVFVIVGALLPVIAILVALRFSRIRGPAIRRELEIQLMPSDQTADV